LENGYRPEDIITLFRGDNETQEARAAFGAKITREAAVKGFREHSRK
jgi:hypothetical protein